MGNKLAKVIVDTIWGDIDYYKDKITGKRVLFISSTVYEFTKRNYTKSELDELEDGWEESKHLMARMGYRNILKGSKVTVANKEFPINCIRFIKKNLSKYDYIVVDYNYKLLRNLARTGIDYMVLLPSAFMKEEIIGHCFISGVSDVRLHVLEKSWNNWLNGLNNTCEKFECTCYKLDNGENLAKVLTQS